MSARLVFCLFLASSVQSGFGRRIANTPGSVLSEQKADTWSSSRTAACVGGYCMESSCREEYREGWSSEEREECFDHGYNMRCDSGYVRGAHNLCHWARVDCAVHWSSWSACSAQCGGGTTTRTAKVLRHAAHGGRGCPSHTQSTSCNGNPCPVHCAGSWGDWTPCPKSCGTGTQSRVFSATTLAAHGGDDCPADESRSCSTDPCPQDCEGSWGQWSSCSTTCGVGEQQREFIVSVAEANGGESCPGPGQKQHCNEDACPKPAPVVVEEKVVQDEAADDVADEFDLELDLEVETEKEVEEEDEWEHDPKAAVQKCRGLVTDPTTGEPIDPTKRKKARAVCVCNLANKEKLSSKEVVTRCGGLRLDAMKVAGPFTCNPKEQPIEDGKKKVVCEAEHPMCRWNAKYC